MLTLITEGDEHFNEKTQTFNVVNSVTIKMEHSLVSMSKWESKYKKPFLSTADKTVDELVDYYAMMIIDDTDPSIIRTLSKKDFSTISEYMGDSQSATTFREVKNRRPNNTIVTTEIIYSWLVLGEIPMEAEYWNLNRLFSLIRIVGDQRSPKKKMSANEVRQSQRELNEKRMAQYNTKG